jgi:hypothetical protein
MGYVSRNRKIINAYKFWSENPKKGHEKDLGADEKIMLKMMLQKYCWKLIIMNCNMMRPKDEILWTRWRTSRLNKSRKSLRRLYTSYCTSHSVTQVMLPTNTVTTNLLLTCVATALFTNADTDISVCHCWYDFLTASMLLQLSSSVIIARVNFCSFYLSTSIWLLLHQQCRTYCLCTNTVTGKFVYFVNQRCHR